MLGSFIPRTMNLLVLVWAVSATAQDTENNGESSVDDRSADQRKIEAAIESYVAAFNAKDVDKLI